MKYQLKVTEKQLSVIQTALEEYFRLRMGQVMDFSKDICSINVPTNGCISRDAAIDLAKNLMIPGMDYLQYNQAIMNYEAELVRLPSAEPERKTGYWIPQDHNNHIGTSSTLVYYYPICSKCGHSGNYDMNYCPNCGARMEEPT